MRVFTIFAVAILITTLNSSCGEEKKDEEKKKGSESVDASEPVVEEEPVNQDWIDVQSKVSRMNQETSYEEIITELGKPFEEYASPSLPEEYVMFYNVPGVNGALFWVMIDKNTKKFLYWSGEKQEK